MRLGNVPRQLDLIIETTKLNRVIEHDDANLTATVESGCPLADLQKTLAPRRQQAPFDPPFAQRATVGGIVAANLNGPRRSFHGSVRDLIIGMKVVLGDGERIKAGGKVVKNVAGYDMGKLFVGSLGTLGVITEITLRMATLAELEATVSAAGTLSQVLQFVDELSRSPLLPAAVLLTNLAAADEISKHWHATILCEGFGETVARHLRDIQASASRMAINSACLSDEDASAHWQRVRDFPLHGDALTYRLVVPRSAVAPAVSAICGWSSDSFTPVFTVDAVAGVIWIAAQPSEEAAEQFPKLVALAQQHHGHAVLFAAPPELKNSLDVWGPSPPTLALMSGIKGKFDPQGILNPGRFLNGL
jgi:glycolate oxidase FAD binding subunit